MALNPLEPIDERLVDELPAYIRETRTAVANMQTLSQGPQDR